MSGPGPSRAADPPIVPDTASICPYLLAAGGAWRASTASREHRCTAVAPPAVLAAEKQRRLCLVVDHATCSTFLAARAARDAAGGAHVGRGPLRAMPRTSPLVLDQGRIAVGLPGLPDRGVGQGGLVALMAVAFGAIAVTRMTGGGPDVVPAAAGGASSSPAAVASASPVTTSRAAAPTATPAASPERTLVPSDVEPTPAPTAASGSTSAPSNKAGTYKVKSGDSLSGIAAAHGTTWQVLAELNDIKDPKKLRVGQVLTLP